MLHKEDRIKKHRYSSGYNEFMNGYFLYQSSRLESFPERFPRIFLQENPLSDPVYIIVQNSGLGEWLVRFLAKNQGAVMGPRILMPEQALRQFAPGYPTARTLLFNDTASKDSTGFPAESPARRGNKGLLFMDGMKLTVFKALEEVLQGEDPVYAPLRAYVASQDKNSSDNSAIVDERLWQLSNAIAGIFYHYGMNCLPMVEAWDRGDLYLNPGNIASGSFSDSNFTVDIESVAEAWQQRLWRRIFHKNAPYTHLSRVLSEVMTSGESYSVEDFGKVPAGFHFLLPPSPPVRIVLFGSMFLGETGLRFFRYLSADFEVHHFMLTPSTIFAISPGTDRIVPEAQERLFADPTGHENPVPSGCLPREAVQPFLRNNGRLLASFATLLPAFGAGKIAVDDHWDNPGEEGTLLHRLRASMIDNAPQEGVVEDDGSLAFHNVSGPRRAVEVLKDRILEALGEDDTLAPTQIGILAPDISSYAPYIESIFPSRLPTTFQSVSDASAPVFQESTDHLNFNLIDLPARSEAPYPVAFTALRALPGSRFGRTTLLNLFNNPCFVPSSGYSGGIVKTGEVWRDIVEKLHIRWGVDEDHRQQEGAADTRTGAWETAFERLLAGYYHDENDRVDLLPANLPGDGDAEIAGELMHVIRTLDEDFRHMDAERCSLKDWTLTWEKRVERWLAPRREGGATVDERDRLRIREAFRDLLTLNEDTNGLSDFSGDRIPWSAFSSLLEEFVNTSSGRRGRYLSRGITCASLKPTRAIPFRRIYILGLDEGAWPGHEKLTGFDLREKVPEFIDLSREAVDRFAFLETIFSARDHLSLFYTGRDPERGDPLSPASPLVELFEHLGEGASTLIRCHPLNPFHPLALQGKGPLATSSKEALALGELLYSGLKHSAPESLPLRSVETKDIIEWQTFVKFLKNPVEYFYLRQLGTVREEGEIDSREDDILEAEPLDWWKWCHSHVVEQPESLLSPEQFVADFRRQLTLEGSVSNTPVGEIQAESLEVKTNETASALKQLMRMGLDIGDAFSCRFMPEVKPDSSGEVMNLPSPIIREEQIHITGSLGGLRFLRAGEEEIREIWTMLEFIPAAEIQPKHKIYSWVAALMIGAAMGDNAPEEIRVFRLGPGIKRRPVRRFFFQVPHCPKSGESSEEEIVLLENPSSILAALFETFRAGESAPLVLYPELAGELDKAGVKDHTEESLVKVAAKAWKDIINKERSFSTLRDCYYRKHYVKNPNFTDKAFSQAWKNLYRNGGLL